MQSLEDLMDDPYARECDFLDLEKDNEDPDDIPLYKIERLSDSNFEKKPVTEQLKSKPVVNKVEPETNHLSVYLEPEIDFFDEKNNSVDGIKLMQYLGNLGVARVAEEDTSFVHIKNGLVDNITQGQLQNLLMTQLKGDDKVLSALHENIDRLFTKKKLAFIPEKEILILRDDKDTAFLPFKNGVLHITKDGHELIDYQDDTLIWKHQVIDRSFKKDSGGDFEQFIRNTSSYPGLNQNDYKAKINTIGYLLHTYKDPSEAKCVVLTDASLLLDDHNMDHVNGQTGKSVFCEALGYVRNLVRCDGKNIRIGLDRFALQNIKRDHQLILFDDAKKDFRFENLFHMITGGLTIEGKNKPKFSIPFKEAPKLIITTNYPFEGDGESYRGRQHVLEFSDFYNTRNKPMMVHGKRFFDDWDGTEWNKFDTFMAGCLQQYLREGKLTQNRSQNYELKKLKMPEFIRYAENLPLGVKFNRKELFDVYSMVDEKMIPRTFNKSLAQYAKAKEYEINVHKKNGIDRDAKGNHFVTMTKIT
jgi:hypothetical protein